MNISIQHIFPIAKKTLLVVYLVLSSINTVQGQACTICSQSDVDNFTGTLGGTIVISGPDITNLDALADNLNPFWFQYLGLSIVNNPVLIDISGISLIPNLTMTDVVISNNPLLEAISFPLLTRAQYYFDILNNASLDSIYLPELSVNSLNIIDNASLKYIGLSANSSYINLTISNNCKLENLDGMAEVTAFTTMTISNNTQLRYYCGLHNVILDDPSADINITGNLKNPTFEEILLEGTCGNYVRNLIGFETLTDALAGANDHDFIFVERDNTIEVSTIFSGIQKHTLVIRPTTTLTFDAPFTNEGIVINHGTIEMLTGALFTNSGAFVNTGTLVAN